MKQQLLQLAMALTACLSMGSVHAQGYPVVEKTKFGTVSVAADKSLHFNGKPIKPDVVGRMGLAIEESWDLGDEVWVLVANFDGGECPEVHHVITVSAKGATASPIIPTCDELVEAQLINRSLVMLVEGDGAISTHKYVFAQGTLTDNGRVLPHGLHVRAMINDPDGYTNVRQGPDAKSPIVARVDTSDTFMSAPQRGNWWKVRLSNNQEGFMHKSRIVFVRDF